jgi:hypothetical protein
VEKKERVIKEYEEYIKRIENEEVKVSYEGIGQMIKTIEILGPGVSVKAALSLLIKEVARLCGISTTDLIMELFSVQVVDDITRQISKVSTEEDFDTILKRIMKDL